MVLALGCLQYYVPHVIEADGSNKVRYIPYMYVCKVQSADPLTQMQPLDGAPTVLELILKDLRFKINDSTS